MFNAMCVIYTLYMFKCTALTEVFMFSKVIEKKIKIDIIDFPIDETRYFMIFINKI